MSLERFVTSGPGRSARGLTPVVRLAPAKLNLTLAVVGRRPDGFHELHSVMVPLGLADRLAIAGSPGGTDSVHVVAPPGEPAPDCGPPDRNLVVRALGMTRAALRAAGEAEELEPLAVRLEKRIPVAAGLAGGSSDAAAALDGALEAWGASMSLDPPSRFAVAARIGSDVPFFLAGGWAVVEGRGERVSPVPAPRGPGLAGPGLGVLLVTPHVAVSTADVFAAYAAGARPPAGAARASSAHLAGELAAGLDVGRLLERAGILAVANDLATATAAVVPALASFRRAVARLLGRPVGQSGSGPTLWVLYPSVQAAAEAADLVRAALGEGRLVPPGDVVPFVQATHVLAARPPADADKGDR